MELSKKEFKKLRADLLLKNVSMAQIARDLYVSRQFVGQALRGFHESDKAHEVRNYAKRILGSK